MGHLFPCLQGALLHPAVQEDLADQQRHHYLDPPIRSLDKTSQCEKKEKQSPYGWTVAANSLHSKMREGKKENRTHGQGISMFEFKDKILSLQTD